ncbi:MAG: hypothetical protein RLZ84_1124 [Actinomycetota bacterium]
MSRWGTLRLGVGDIGVCLSRCVFVKQGVRCQIFLIEDFFLLDDRRLDTETASDSWTQTECIEEGLLRVVKGQERCKERQEDDHTQPCDSELPPDGVNAPHGFPWFVGRRR